MRLSRLVSQKKKKKICNDLLQIMRVQEPRTSQVIANGKTNQRKSKPSGDWREDFRREIMSMVNIVNILVVEVVEEQQYKQYKQYICHQSRHSTLR